MDLRRLRYFTAVAEELHFGRAAERMHVVQSAISQQIKLLEEELGFPLLERSRHSVRLTVPGEIFLPEARDILRRTEEAVQRVRASAGGAVGRLTIGFVDNALWSVLPLILRQFRAQWPAVELSLQPLDRSSQMEALRGSIIDVGLIPAPPPPREGIESASLIAAPLLVALPCGHPLATGGPVSLGQLQAEPFVLFPPRMRSRLLDIIVTGCAQAGFSPHISQEAEQLHTLLALVSAGLGVTLVPEWVSRSQEAGVAYAPLADALPSYELLSTWRCDAGNPSVAAFRTIAEEVSRGLLADLCPHDRPEQEEFQLLHLRRAGDHL